MTIRKGRGAANNPASRLSKYHHDAEMNSWDNADTPLPDLPTTVSMEAAKSVITYNRSPDLPFDRSINPYRGCEHGCSYCYARPTHAYLDLSPGLDFETRLVVKTNLGALLRRELNAQNYHCRPLVLGANTDPYQPIEKKYTITRDILEILKTYKHPVQIITKASLIERDIDLLSELADDSLVDVMISLTTLDKDIARRMEPRAARPERRLQTISRLVEAGIPTGVMVAPVIPHLTDNELEGVLDSACSAGARSAAYVMLRLPHEVKTLFSQWLYDQFPLKADAVLNRIRDIRKGRFNDSHFGHRLRGEGVFADLIEQRFILKCKRLQLNPKHPSLTTDLFRPYDEPCQLSLF